MASFDLKRQCLEDIAAFSYILDSTDGNILQPKLTNTISNNDEIHDFLNSALSAADLGIKSVGLLETEFSANPDYESGGTMATCNNLLICWWCIWRNATGIAAIYRWPLLGKTKNEQAK